MRTMYKKVLWTCLFAALTMGSVGQAFAWGFWAHQRINRMAVFTLPPEMLVLYKPNIEYITLHAIDPDKRRYAVDGEAPRHYIDVDHYGTYPFDNVPRKWKDAEEKFSEDTLQAYGIVPWTIQSNYYKLVDAFRSGNTERILKLSADIGHYIADSNVPLHTTENYNGQMTDQKGIHGLWESRLPEIFGENYDYFIGKASYVENVLEEAWTTVLESHACLDSVLGFERHLTETMPSDQKYSYENRNNRVGKAYSKAFCMEYHRMLAGQVERRVRTSVIRVGSIWYTAWIDAGQPDLTKVSGQQLEVEEKEYERKLKIIDRESGDLGAVPDAIEAIFGSCCGSRHGNKCDGSDHEAHTAHKHDDEHGEEDEHEK